MGLRLAVLLATLALSVVAPAASATEVTYSADGSTLIVTGGDDTEAARREAEALTGATGRTVGRGDRARVSAACVQNGGA